MQELDRFYQATLGDPPKKPGRVSRLAGMAIEFENLYQLGILPEAGGWLDQDSLAVELIRLASRSRGQRERIQAQKRKRGFGSRFKRRK